MAHPPRPILLVEDSEDIRELLVEVLDLAGLRAEGVADGAGALAWLARGGRPALVLLDFQLPDMDGHTLLARLDAGTQLAGVPVVGISGSEVRNPRLAFTLRKPLGVDELLAAVRRALG